MIPEQSASPERVRHELTAAHTVCNLFADGFELFDSRAGTVVKGKLVDLFPGCLQRCG
jgi:hypothetical protein